MQIFGGIKNQNMPIFLLRKQMAKILLQTPDNLKYSNWKKFNPYGHNTMHEIAKTICKG